MADIGTSQGGGKRAGTVGDEQPAFLVLAGGGLMIHFGGVLSLGAEVNYQGITGTDYKVLSIGPSIVIGG